MPRSALGPHGIGNRGSAWARAVTTGKTKPQLEAPSRPGVRLMKYGGGGFESHLTATAGWQPLARRQVVGPERASPSPELVP
jgi:hypothetical protein